MQPPQHRQPSRKPQPERRTELPLLGQWLRQRRRALDLTQEELAQRVGCARITIRRIEADELKPSHQLAELFAEKLGVPPSQRVAWVQFARGLGPQPDPGEVSSYALLTSPAPTLPTNLPTALTTFVGREQAVADVRGLLAAHRLLTLSGVGGMGKTRLALEIARSIAELDSTDNLQFSDGVWWIELAPLNDPALIPQTLAASLGLREQAGQSLERILAEYLKARRLLLLLDNCEHLVAGCATFVHNWLQNSQHLHILVTSREPLQLRGEQRYPVTPLAAAPACELFVQRARLVDPALTLTADNAPIIDELCRQLDYLPLAIELLAARSALFSPQAMLVRLRERRLELLSGGARDLPARQQTVRRAIQHSYDLLGDDESTLFRTLGVFVGGFDLAAVRHFGFGEETLQSLLHKSLVQVATRQAPGGVEPRFMLLETLREYALEQLVQANEAETAQRTHARYFFSFAARIDQLWQGGDDRTGLDKMEQEVDNLRTALRWTATHEPALEIRFLNHMDAFWNSGRYQNEGWRWIEAALPRIKPECTLDYASFLDGLTIIKWRHGNLAAAQRYAEEGVAIFRQLEHPFRNVDLLTMLASILHDRGDFAAARVVAEESVAISRQLNKPSALAYALWTLQDILIALDDQATARTLLPEAVALWRSLESPFFQAVALRILAQAAFLQGELSTARAQCEGALQRYRRDNERWAVALTLFLLAQITWRQGEKAQATVLLEEQLNLARELSAQGLLRASLLLSGLAALENHDRPRAQTLLTECLALLQENELIHEKGNQVFVAYLLSGFAGLLGLPAQAVRVLGAATRLLITAPGGQNKVIEHAHYEAILAAVRVQLKEAAFVTAWAEGQAMTLDEAVAIAREEA